MYQQNNFGFYAGEDLELFVFYYKDIFKNLQTIFYKLKHEEAFATADGPAQRHFQILCKAVPNTWLSTHSNDFRYYLKQNENEQLEITPYDHMLKDDFGADLYNMTLNYGIRKSGLAAVRPHTLDAEDLEPLNQEIRKLAEVNPDSAPSFVDKNKVAFMSHDKMILVYQIFGESARGDKQLFTATQCRYPGSGPDISMDTL